MTEISYLSYLDEADVVGRPQELAQNELVELLLGSRNLIARSEQCELA
jgi:hypothetical protein